MTFEIGPVVFRGGAFPERREDLHLITLHSPQRFFLKVEAAFRSIDAFYFILQECNLLTIKNQAEFNEMIDKRKYLLITLNEEAVDVKIADRVARQILPKGTVIGPPVDAPHLIFMFVRGNVRGPLAITKYLPINEQNPVHFKPYGLAWTALPPSVPRGGAAAPAAPPAAAPAAHAADAAPAGPVILAQEATAPIPELEYKRR